VLAVTAGIHGGDRGRVGQRGHSVRDLGHAATGGVPGHHRGRGVGQEAPHGGERRADDQFDDERPGDDRDDRAYLVADQGSGACSDGGQQRRADDGAAGVAGDGGIGRRDRVAPGGGEAKRDRGRRRCGGDPEHGAGSRRGHGLCRQHAAPPGLVKVGVSGGLEPELAAGYRHPEQRSNQQRETGAGQVVP
jgi:hypothetical protein